MQLERRWLYRNSVIRMSIQGLDQVMNIGRGYATYMAQLNQMDPNGLATALGRQAPP